MKQNSFDDCRVVEETDDGQDTVTLWADERVRFVYSLYQPSPIALFAK